MSDAALSDTKKKRVLAVDDEQEVLRLYDTFLRYRGYDVIALNRAEECLAFLAADVADILLLDVNMPGIDGLKVLEMIRSDERLQDMRVIMITARRDEETVRRAAKLGIDDFVIKPFKLRELAERIAIELFAITDAELRNIFKAPMQMRTSQLRQQGLTDFDPLHWDSYPVRYRNQDLCILMPRGTRPSRFSKALTHELEKRVIVYFRHPQRWKKIWPPR